VHHTTGCASPLLRHDRQGVLGGVPGMDDEWLAGHARGADVGPEAVSLPIHILPLHPVVIQTGFTDSHHPGMASQLNQFID
jgi:hypothetical protein